MLPAPSLSRLPPTPDLSAVADTVAENYALYHQVADQLTGLQTWINQQKDIANEHR